MLKSIFHRKLSAAAMDAGVTEVAKNVLWIGCNDWDLREFHSMRSPVGTSYNSYLIQSSKPTIIDAVKAPFYDQWVSRLQSIYGEDLHGISYILMQHAEPDHTSALPILLQRFPHIQLLCTKENYDTLSRFYCNKNWNYKLVKLGEQIQLGDKTVVMAGIPMAHWPEQAVTYIPDQKILFTSDVFGQHIATTKRFVDEIDQCLFYNELKSYYANILLRLRNPVLKALKTAASLPGIDMILPSHGVGLRRPEDIARATKIYADFANQVPTKKLSVLYECNWFGAEKMAEAVASGAGKEGIDVKMFHARRTHITNVATEMIDSAGIAVGSACLHESILPDLAGHLNYLKCLNIRDKVGSIFGTYGWSKNVIPKEVRQQLFTPTKVKEVSEPILAHWSPDDNDLRRCEELGKLLGKSVKEVLDKSK
ncbi:Hydrogenosomal oxygen reductase [Tritrichomonas foetus]|uniref:Hydrogenosomal oxygen reductase n=1 Tax=Tritrichomonas foetus TaxID=1144522 RepID=A0A1J4JGD8_9EUKA|nr:hydrogenosomal oxygen reductase [Tritrichomonas foetus]OHS98254.1 Hydrogenosomal oxygen reductase [Tritrichomonas foetus]|eukprot:OHS98254.1 Hydrogenosomal oxygen reductase [Tritrichomonas foetus]